jgi:hypothetical protein
MAAKLTRLTHKIAIQVHLVAQSCTICSFRSWRPVRKLLDTHSYTTKLTEAVMWLTRMQGSMKVVWFHFSQYPVSFLFGSSIKHEPRTENRELLGGDLCRCLPSYVNNISEKYLEHWRTFKLVNRSSRGLVGENLAGYRYHEYNS